MMLLAKPSWQLNLMVLAECSIISSTSIYSLQSTQDFVVKEQKLFATHPPAL
jgi:hypothetical protein